jgi:hypothetical protein
MNMMTMGMITPPDLGTPADFTRLLQLIAVVANPEASKALLEQLAVARDEAQAKADEAVIKGAKIEVAEREHSDKMKREREQHANALAAAKNSFDQECAGRLSKLQAAENDAYGTKREAEKLLEEAKAARADLDRRLEILRAATA